MEFFCAFCGKRGGEPQSWLLALEMLKPGTDLRNTLVYLDQWDERLAQDSNALYFCSKDCQRSYLAHWKAELVA